MYIALQRRTEMFAHKAGTGPAKAKVVRLRNCWRQCVEQINIYWLTVARRRERCKILL